MNYDQARPNIRSGDLIFFDAKTKPQRAITFITGGSVSHCGIATWMCDSVGTPRLMLVEAFVGGCRLINLRSYSYRPMIAVNIGLPWSHVESYALDKTGAVGYSGLDFITIGARDILLRLGLRRLAESTVFTYSTGEVCSEMVADVIVTSKLAPDLGTLWSPNSLYKELHERNLVQSMLRIENQPKENEK